MSTRCYHGCTISLGLTQLCTVPLVLILQTVLLQGPLPTYPQQPPRGPPPPGLDLDLVHVALSFPFRSCGPDDPAGLRLVFGVSPV